jgi:hypothetical protein
MPRLLRSETTQTKFVVGFGLLGFAIGIALCAYAFYLTSHHQIGNAALFLILCPPSIGAIALDNAGVLGGVIAWFGISLLNAGLYAGIGFALGAATKKPQ